jgi:arylsulfatase A-like enzyme
MAELEWQGLAGDTIVVMAGDNGLALGQHGLMGKQNLYEHSVRVPLLMSGPGVPKGQRRDSPCYLLDIFPTLCGLTGLAVPESVQGRSLVAALSDRAGAARDVLYLAYSSVQRGVKDRSHKLIEYVVGGERTTQLFDLARDPRERENLAGRPGQAALLRQMRMELLRERDAWDDRATPWGAAFWQGYDNPGRDAGGKKETT